MRLFVVIILAGCFNPGGAGGNDTSPPSTPTQVGTRFGGGSVNVRLLDSNGVALKEFTVAGATDANLDTWSGSREWAVSDVYDDGEIVVQVYAYLGAFRDEAMPENHSCAPIQFLSTVNVDNLNSFGPDGVTDLRVGDGVWKSNISLTSEDDLTGEVFAGPPFEELGACTPDLQWPGLEAVQMGWALDLDTSTPLYAEQVD